MPVVAVTDPSALQRAGLGAGGHQGPGHRLGAAVVRNAVGPGTVIVMLQNGIDHASRLGRLADDMVVLPALVHINLEPLARGQVWQATKSLCRPARKALGWLTCSPEPEIKIRLEPDFRSAAWRKLLHNVAHNPILALTGRRADLFEEPEVLALAAS